jgi:hypothetical protein
VPPSASSPRSWTRPSSKAPPSSLFPQALRCCPSWGRG